VGFCFQSGVIAVPVLVKEIKKKRKDYTFRRQFNENRLGDT